MKVQSCCRYKRDENIIRSWRVARWRRVKNNYPASPDKSTVEELQIELLWTNQESTELYEKPKIIKIYNKKENKKKII